MLYLPPETHVGFAHLQVSNLPRSLAFYRDLLGFRLISQSSSSSDPKSASLSASGNLPAHLILSELPGAVRKPPHTIGLYHVAIRFPDRVSLARAFIRLRDRGWAFIGAADHLVSEAIYLLDPDGLGLEIYVDRPRQSWPRNGDQVLMASDPLDLDSLLAEAGEDPSPWQGLHPQTDIGHIHLQVSDLVEGEKFYAHTLGLEVTQRSYMGALFLAAGGYHHHVAINIWAGRGAPSPPPDAVGLRAFSLVLPGDTARHEASSRLEAHGIGARDYEYGPLFHSTEDIGIVLA